MLGQWNQSRHITVSRFHFESKILHSGLLSFIFYSPHAYITVCLNITKWHKYLELSGQTSTQEK